VSVSLPFFTVSLQAGAVHFFVPALQTPLVQSAAMAQAFVSAHFVVHEPPQSASVSVPFFTVSVQAGAEHVFVPGSHTPLVQSAATAQVFVSAHLPHEPPQSISVSVPFFVVSVHEMAMHLPPLHRLVVQSAATAQPLPSAHFVAQEPPQSTSASVPFLILSVQVAAGGGVVPVVVGVGVGVGVVAVVVGVGVVVPAPPSSLEHAATQGTAAHASSRTAPMALVDGRVDSLFIG
jgi:hypothetical protein